jgi:hypothetical protein
MFLFRVFDMYVVKVLGGHPKDKCRHLKHHTSFYVQQQAMGNTCTVHVCLNIVAFGAQLNYGVSVSAFILLCFRCLWLNMHPDSVEWLIVFWSGGWFLSICYHNQVNLIDDRPRMASDNVYGLCTADGKAEFTNHLYLYFYDPLSLFSTHKSYPPQQPNHRDITTK